MQCNGGADSTKSDRGVAYRFLITFEINALVIKLLKKWLNGQMLFTLYSKSLIYYTRFENSLMSFLTFAVFD